jgi:hypothetical protein
VDEGFRRLQASIGQPKYDRDPRRSNLAERKKARINACARRGKPDLRKAPSAQARET